MTIGFQEGGGVMLGRSSVWESHNIGFAWQAQMQEEESSFFEWKL